MSTCIQNIPLTEWDLILHGTLIDSFFAQNIINTTASVLHNSMSADCLLAYPWQKYFISNHCATIFYQS